MDADTATLIRELLKLPVEVRAALAGSLLESLDETLDPDIEAAWESEIASRLKELDESHVKTIPWSEVRRKIAGN